MQWEKDTKMQRLAGADETSGGGQEGRQDVGLKCPRDGPTRGDVAVVSAGPLTPFYCIW